MAERTYTTFYDDNGAVWRVSLYDSSYASTATEVVLENPGFQISWKGDGDERFSPIKASECTIYFQVEDSNDKAIITSIIGAQEERFAIRIQKGDDLYWVGWVLPDLISIEDAPCPYTVAITATDGLGRLSDIEYWDDGTPYTGDSSFLKIIDQILDHVKLDDFWGATDSYIRTEVNWYEDSHPTAAANKDPLEYSRLDEVSFLDVELDDFGNVYQIKVDEDGNAIPMSCLDVLEQVCKAWGMRCYIGGGMYRFQQINELAGTSVYYREWDKSLTLQGSGTYNPRLTVDQDNVAKLATGIDTFYPALLKVEADHVHHSGYNLLGASTNLAVDTALSQTTLGTVASGLSNSFRIGGRMKFVYDPATPAAGILSFRIGLQIKLIVNSAYSYSGTTIPGYPTGVNSGVAWNNNATSAYYIWDNKIFYINDPNPQSTILNFDFGTLPIPDDGVATLEITPYYQALGSANVTPWSEADFYLQNLSARYVVGADTNTTSVEVVNTTNGTTYVNDKTTLELGDILIGDQITSTSLGAVEVSDDLSTWSVSSEWAVGGSGTTYGMTELLCREVLAGQKRPKRKMQATIYGAVNPQSVLYYDSLPWVFNSMTLSGIPAEISGEWFEISTDDTYLVTTVDDEVIDDNGSGLGTLNLVTGITQQLGNTTAAAVNYLDRRSLASTSARLGGGDTITEIDIVSIGSQIISNGDVLYLFNPYTGESEAVTVSSTPTSDATSIDVEEVTLDYTYPPGSKLLYTTPAEITKAFDPTKTGFPDDYEDDVTLSFVDGTRTFSITPTGASFEYFIGGVKFIHTSAQSVTITDTEGIWFFYFVQDTLTASQVAWSSSANDKAFVAILYWDATNNRAISAPAYECHGWQMDASVHHYLHATFGTRWESGLAVSINGTTTIDVSAGTIHDEDIAATITDGAGGSVWEQVLSPAELPILYRTGASGEWRNIAATSVPCYLDSNVLQYNAYEGGVWSLEDCALNKYVAYWVIASTTVAEPVFLVPGQEASDTLGDARDGNSSADMLFGNLPVAEFKIIARLLIKRESSSPYYSVDEVNDYRSSSGDSSTAAPVVGDHGALTGLGDDDHSQYMAMARAGDIAGLSAKATPVAADMLVIEDSAASNAKKKITVDKLWMLPTGTKTTGVDNGTPGQVYWDDDYIYVCTDTNVWKKAPLRNTN